jgi:hypothetical protein
MEILISNQSEWGVNLAFSDSELKKVPKVSKSSITLPKVSKSYVYGESSTLLEKESDMRKIDRSSSLFSHRICVCL